MSARLMNRTERLAAIEQMLFRSAIGLRAVELASACGVDRRTIYRDLTLLSDVGIPLHQKDGRFYIDRQNYTATIRLNFDETVALFLAARLASRRVNEHNPHTVSALNKLSMGLPTPLAAHIDVVTEVATRNPANFRYINILETVTRAWGERRKVKLWCTGREGGKPRAREFCTYLIEPTPSGAVYAIGFDSLTQQIRAFKLQRVRRARLLSTTYQTPTQFDARRYLLNGWAGLNGNKDNHHTVVLIFASEIAVSLKERVWQGAQKIEILDDNRVRLSLHVADWREILPWIRSWGAGVEAVEPVALREALAQDAAHMHRLYGAAAASS
jgi:predicted DNA-binding transcriptional regulator YafY